MKKETMQDGYELMMNYIKDNRIKTKHRNFVRRLERFYEKNIMLKHYGQGEITGELELQFLKLEQEFFNDICPPSTTQDQAQIEVLNIMILQKEQEMTNNED